MKTLVTSLVQSRHDYCNSILYGLPASSIKRLQVVQNAAARLVFNIRRNDHVTVTDSLICLHWLRIAERIRFKTAVMVYRALNQQLPPSYLHGFVVHQAGRSDLRSATTQRLLIPRTKRSSIGDRSFFVAGARVWNDLPSEITFAPSLSIFRSKLSTLTNLDFPILPCLYNALLFTLLTHCVLALVYSN